jgi:hypothetical protein
MPKTGLRLHAHATAAHAAARRSSKLQSCIPWITAPPEPTVNSDKQETSRGTILPHRLPPLSSLPCPLGFFRVKREKEWPSRVQEDFWPLELGSIALALWEEWSWCLQNLRLRWYVSNPFARGSFSCLCYRADLAADVVPREPERRVLADWVCVDRGTFGHGTPRP